MSSSKTDQNQFEALSVSSLDAFEDEVSKKTDESEPDFDRFKLLVEKPVFDQEENINFEAVYNEQEEKEEEVFKPLIEEKETASSEVKAQEDPAYDQSDTDNDDPAEPEETPEEQAYREGFEQGVKDGEQKGLDQGYDKGFEKGEAEGFEQGKEQGLEQGREQGLEQGLKEGRETGEEETKKTGTAILNLLQETLEKVDRSLEQIVDTYEGRIILLIQEIAHKAVLAKIEIDEEIVKPMVLDALKKLVQPEEVDLSVSAEDYEYIEMIKDEFFEQIDSLKRISVQSDPSVKKGGCKIETKTASVSSDPQSRLEAIFEAMKNSGEV